MTNNHLLLPFSTCPSVSSSTVIATSSTFYSSVSTSTQYTVYSPFSNYTSSSLGLVTTYFTLNGVLVGAYSYQQGNEAGSGKISYFLSNYEGSPVLSTDDKGDIVEMDVTDVFGNYVHRDQRVDNALHTKGYTGHEYDDTTNLLYGHARYIDTTAHSFLSVDPMIYSIPQSYLTDPQQMNSYAYARNNPIIYTDPSGKFINLIPAAIGAVVGGIIGGAVAGYNGQSVIKGAAIGATAGGVAGLTFGLSLAATTATGIGTWAAITASGGVSGMVGGMTGRALTGQQVFNPTAIQQDNAFGGLLSLGGYGVGKAVGSALQGSASSNPTARFTQTGVSPNFSSTGDFSGASVNSVVSGLKDGSIKPSSMPVSYINGNNGVRLVDNNRSAYSLQQAGIPELQWNWQKGDSEVILRVLRKLDKNGINFSGLEDIPMTKGN